MRNCRTVGDEAGERRSDEIGRLGDGRLFGMRLALSAQMMHWPRERVLRIWSVTCASGAQRIEQDEKIAFEVGVHGKSNDGAK